MPIDRGIIDQQLQELGEGQGWWERRELRDLPAVLHADERIAAIASGKRSRRETIGRPWLIVVTDRRLLCLRSAGGSGWKQLEIPARQITRTALRVGPFRARVLLVGNGPPLRLYVTREDGYKLLTALGRITPPRPAPAGGVRPTLMIRRVFSHMLDLPAVALDPGQPKVAAPAPPTTGPLEDRLQQLETEVEELREQVRFLEQLLQERHPAHASQMLGSG